MLSAGDGHRRKPSVMKQPEPVRSETAPVNLRLESAKEAEASSTTLSRASGRKSSNMLMKRRTTVVEKPSENKMETIPEEDPMAARLRAVEQRNV